MMSSHTYTLIDPHNGRMVFRISNLDDQTLPPTVQRLSCYTLILLTEGNARLQANFADDAVGKNTLLGFTPFQPFRLETGDAKGFVLHFHPDFFCIIRHHHEVACNGILFNNIYQAPFHVLGEPDAQKLVSVIRDMREELEKDGLAQNELVVALLKIFLITASRSRLEVTGIQLTREEPFVLQKLKDAIEAHYRSKHAPGEYAEMLHISAKALARIAKNHFNRTLTHLISERIVIEAKRELYLTSKPVKAIAAELGFKDEYHFSRFFKNKVQVSPQIYRNQVGYAKGEA